MTNKYDGFHDEIWIRGGSGVALCKLVEIVAVLNCRATLPRSSSITSSKATPDSENACNRRSREETSDRHRRLPSCHARAAYGQPGFPVAVCRCLLSYSATPTACPF